MDGGCGDVWMEGGGVVWMGGGAFTSTCPKGLGTEAEMVVAYEQLKLTDAITAPASPVTPRLI